MKGRSVQPAPWVREGPAGQGAVCGIPAPLGQWQPRVPNAVPLDQQPGESCQSPGGRALAPAGKEHKAAGLRGPAVFAFRPERSPPLLRPPAVPSHRETENMFLLVADGFYFHFFGRSDTYTAMLSPYEGQGLQRKAPCPAGSPSLLRLGWHWTGGMGESGGKKKKIKFSSDRIYLNKYKYIYLYKTIHRHTVVPNPKGRSFCLFLFLLEVHPEGSLQVFVCFAGLGGVFLVLFLGFFNVSPFGFECVSFFFPFKLPVGIQRKAPWAMRALSHVTF